MNNDNNSENENEQLGSCFNEWKKRCTSIDFFNGGVHILWIEKHCFGRRLKNEITFQMRFVIVVCINVKIFASFLFFEFDGDLFFVFSVNNYINDDVVCFFVRLEIMNNLSELILIPFFSTQIRWTIITYHLSLINYQLSIINYQLSIINYQLSLITYQLSIINYQLSIINYHLSLINYQLSLITYHLSLINYHLSLINYHLSLITYHLSIITYHLSIINYQLSIINYQSSLRSR
jgi:hypothetical protein